MFRRTGVVRKVTGVLTLVMLLVLYARVAEAQSISDEIAECVTDAWDEYLECIDDLPWWAELLCAARFSSDTILCFPKEFIPK